MKKAKQVLLRPMAYLSILLIMAIFLTGCKAQENEPDIKYTEVSDFTGATVGSQTGTMFNQILNGSIAGLNHKYYDDISSMMLALRNRHIDAVGLDEPVARFAAAQNPDFQVFNKIIQTDNYGLPMTKNGKLTGAVSQIIQEYTADGTLEKLKAKWFSGDAAQMHIDSSLYTVEAPVGTLRLIHDSTQMPMSYVEDNGKSAGYEVELVLMIAQRLNLKVEITQSNFSGLMTAIAAGKADIAAGSISITDERRESVDFPQTHYVGGIVLLCRKSDLSITAAEQQQSIWQKLSIGFEKTFLRESRWKMIASGLAITLIISLLSLLFGTLLGLLVCSLRRSKNRVVSGITSVIIRLIQGIPVVILLMVLYYLVFASTKLNGVLIAIIGFSLNFGINAAEIIRAGIESVNPAQWETADCLGMNKSQTFFKVILPQSLLCFLPSFKGEFINMMKMTSVVGYISVQDLTKASDIIRSHTYDAFFPLLVNTVIYVFLAWSMATLIGLIEYGVSPQKRTRGLKNITPEVSDTPFSFKELPDIGTEIIRTEHLTKVYHTHPTLSDVNISINSGDVVSVIGPSGSGKSTFLRLINHLETPTEGTVYIHEKDMSLPKNRIAERKKIGMVFQSFELFSHLTVIENVMLAPITVNKVSRQQAYENAVRLLRMVGMGEKLLHYPHELSGGQRQRVAIARTLAMSPDIILLDEPTSALDPTSVAEVLSVIRSLADKGFTLLIVTHEMEFSETVASRVFYLDQQCIYESGTPEQIFHSPKKPKTRQFIYHLNILEETIISRHFDFVGIQARIEQYGQKYGIPFKTVRRMQTAFEEAATQIILPALSGKFKLVFTAESSEKTAQVTLYFRYSGERLDATETADPLSKSLLENAVRHIEYHYDPGTPLANEIMLKL